MLNADDRVARLAVAFAREVATARPKRLCSVCADILTVTGAGITIMGGDHAGPICVSNRQVRALEDLQFTIGQGPCHDALRSGRPIHAPRLDAAAAHRWPNFVDLAGTSGIGAVFAYPLVPQANTIGVLTLYQHDEGDLTATQHDDSLALATILTETVLSMQDVASDGALAPGLEEAVAYRAEIYQASGMVAIQLQIPAAEAMVRIRAHAFATGRTVAAVASDIVARRLRLADDRGSDDRDSDSDDTG